MTRRSAQRALAGRGFMLFPAAAFAVHQLRYQLAYGSRAGAALSAQGHGYLTSLAPWVAVLAGVAAGSFLARLARAATGRPDGRPRRSFATLWLATFAGLLAAYSLQEWLEGVFAAGHPGGVAGVFGHGGLWAVPLSALAALAVSALLRLAALAVDAVAPVDGLMRLVASVALLRPGVPAPPRRAALAGNVSDRAPPAGLVAA
jgi:hypothetical protein